MNHEALACRIEVTSPEDLVDVRAAYEHARAMQRERSAIVWPEFNWTLIEFYGQRGFRLVEERRLGADPRLPPHYHGNTFALLERNGTKWPAALMSTPRTSPSPRPHPQPPR